MLPVPEVTEGGYHEAARTLMGESAAQSDGRLVAAALAGSWRPAPPPPDCSAARLEEIAPLLVRSGAAPLCWRWLRHSELRSLPAAAALQQAYRYNILITAVREQKIERAFAALRAAGVEPILVKGWAAARLYPERGLRPYADVDLCVRAEQFEDARVALWEALGHGRAEVDLHGGFARFGGGGVGEIYARSQMARLGATDVRVPCAEDHLRVLSVHMLREGAWRALWLCDVAAAVEAAGDDFDWERCLTRDSRLAGWVNCAMRAAHELLGADIRRTPAARAKRPLPRWLVPTILKEWGARLPSMAERHLAPMAYLRTPAEIWEGLRHRWPNPVEATVGAGAPFNGWPRLPFQLGTCLARTVKFAARLPGARRRQPAKVVSPLRDD